MGIDAPSKGSAPLEAHFRYLLPLLRINCVLDVGANRGQFATMLRRIGYRGRIVSFEPVTESYAALEALANHDPNWHTYHCALGATAATREIHVTRSSVFASFLNPNEYGNARYAESTPVVRGEQVRIRTLDEIYTEVTGGDVRPFLKMDTQGYDLQVFAGATRSLPAILGLQSEISIQAIYERMPGYLEALRAYTQAGFVISGLYPVSRDRETLALIELDCVMRRIKQSA